MVLLRHGRNLAIIGTMATKPDRKLFTTLYLRETPRDVAQRLKAAAALKGKSLNKYVVEVLRDHVRELERKGVLPKGK